LSLRSQQQRPKPFDDRTTTLHVPFLLRVGGITDLKSAVFGPSDNTRSVAYSLSVWHERTNRLQCLPAAFRVEAQMHGLLGSRCKRGPISHVSRISAQFRAHKAIYWRTYCRCVLSALLPLAILETYSLGSARLSLRSQPNSP
jgi:hypothetical protein